jgi:hypothetical protein
MYFGFVGINEQRLVMFVSIYSKAKIIREIFAYPDVLFGTGTLYETKLILI